MGRSDAHSGIQRSASGGGEPRAPEATVIDAAESCGSPSAGAAEVSLPEDDPFGGLIPVDDADPPTAPTGTPEVEAPRFRPVSVTSATLPAYPAVASLTLTQRHSVPRVLKSFAQMTELKIDHRAGFLLAHVDGMQTLEEILDICAMPAAVALELLFSLAESGVIEFE